MALLDDNPELDLYDREWLIHTRSEERAPAKVGPTAQVHRSLISHGCVINGTVVNSVLSPGVRVDVGAVVRDSIVMFDTVIRSGAVVDRAILDKEVVVGQGAIVGDGPDFDTPNRAGAGAAEHGDHGRRQAVRHAARRPAGPQREGRREGASPPTSRTGPSAPAARSTTSRATRRAAKRVDAERATGAASSRACRTDRSPQARARVRRRGVPGPSGRLPPCPSPPGRRRCRCRRRGLARRAGSRAPGARRPRGRHVVGPRPRRHPPRRAPDHADPRPVARAHLLGPLRPADQRLLPQVVPACCCAGTTSCRS